jgi:hypothetical protein
MTSSPIARRTLARWKQRRQPHQELRAAAGIILGAVLGSLIWLLVALGLWAWAA